MKTIDTGVYFEQGKHGQRFVIEWSKLGALSEAFADKMESVSSLGVDSFKSAEIDFLEKYPQAMDEDQSLASFQGLKLSDLEDAMDRKLLKIFHTRPSDFNDQVRSAMGNSYYYFVTVKEESSDKIQGFITFMGGSPLSENEYKITILAINQNVRRSGLAGLLVASLEKIRDKPSRIYVCTRPSNIAAISAYKKWGFVEDQETEKNASPHFIKGHWVHLVRF
jgi:ribosomal protein S18 acetylase RimI-like enzyme